MALILPPTSRPTSRPPSVTALTREEMGIMARFHDLAQRHNWALVCIHCDGAIQGSNCGHDRVLSIRCRCREWQTANPSGSHNGNNGHN